MERVATKGKTTFTFESPEDLKGFVKDRPEGANSKGYQGSDFNPYSWEETMEALDKGWDGVDGMVEKVESLSASMLDSIGTDYRWDVVGQFVDVGTFVTGNPECWIEQEPAITPKETIVIRVNVGTNANTTADTIVNRGAVIAALIDALYDRYFIDITFITNAKGVYGASRDQKKNIECRYHLNTKNGYSKNMVAFYSAHPALLRRMSFAVREIEFDVERRLGDYGSTDDIDSKGADIVFPQLAYGEESKYSTIEKSEKTLKEILEKVLKVN